GPVALTASVETWLQPDSVTPPAPTTASPLVQICPAGPSPIALLPLVLNTTFDPAERHVISGPQIEIPPAPSSVTLAQNASSVPVTIRPESAVNVGPAPKLTPPPVVWRLQPQTSFCRWPCPALDTS